MSNLNKHRSPRRRAVTAVMVALLIPVVVGFAALTIDVGVMYSTKADLQRAADAAALAAASQLGSFAKGDPLNLARDAAMEVTRHNDAFGHAIELSPGDVTLGHASVNPQTGVTTFTPTNLMPNAAQVVARRTEGSPNGALALHFARIFGIEDANIHAQATAMLIPRDIAVVADMSRSHNYDSTFKQYKSTTPNMFDVWDALPGGIDDDGTAWPGDAGSMSDEDLAQRAGPAWGLFQRLGYGTRTIDASYDPAHDDGLIRLAENTRWNDATLTSYLRDRGYSNAEIGVVMAPDFDRNGGYGRRVAVALGLAAWNSGIPGGLWEASGTRSSGDRNRRIEANELAWIETFGDRSVSESEAIFTDYINNYVRSSRSQMAGANSDLRYRYGVKTFVDYLLNERAANDQTPELADTPHQPMQAVKDAVTHLATTLESLQSYDRLSLEIYGTEARHELNLTDNYFNVTDRLNGMQAGHYNSYTNMGGGIRRAIEELTSSRASSVSRKIMFVLTDGYANVACDGCTRYDPEGGRAYALAEARAAAAEGIQVFAISVGADSDLALMEEIAAIGNGAHFHAEGSIGEYSARLDAIFQELGGRQPVALIE